MCAEYHVHRVGVALLAAIWLGAWLLKRNMMAICNFHKFIAHNTVFPFFIRAIFVMLVLEAVINSF